MVRLFEDGFETGDASRWDGINITAGPIVVNSDHPHHGAYNLCSTYLSTAIANSHACIYKGCAGHNHLFARAMNCIIDRGPPSTGWYRRHLIFGFYEYPIGSSICGFGIYNDGGVLKWLILYRHAGAFASLIGGIVALNTPYAIECEIKRSDVGMTNGEARLWVNGKPVLEITGLDNSDRTINIATFGFCNSETNLNGDQHFWGDCYVLSDHYIGSEEVTPTPKPCFIATAAYGTPLAPELNILRKFRDKCLPDKIVACYYKVSPQIANYIWHHSKIRSIVRKYISLLVSILRR